MDGPPRFDPVRQNVTQADRERVRNRYLERCERCGVPTPLGQVHHRRSRSVRDALTHRPGNLTWLCAPDHRWVHSHPMLARNEGFIVSRLVAVPSAIPVHTPWGAVIFLDSGDVVST